MYLITDIRQVHSQEEQAFAIGGLQSEVGAIHEAIKERQQLVKQGNLYTFRPQHY